MKVPDLPLIDVFGRGGVLKSGSPTTTIVACLGSVRGS
jgi:hypothetical protein